MIIILIITVVKITRHDLHRITVAMNKSTSVTEGARPLSR